MLSSILGTRIRQRRRELGTTQAELAKKVDISPSYLNLIEWNKRRIAGPLLGKIAAALDITLSELDDVSERRLSITLGEVAHLPALNGLGVEEERINELIGRFPGWARGLAALARSEREATERAYSLSDRLTNDPYLSENVHRMLTRIAAIRSVSEIITGYPDVPADRRDQFDQIIFEESQALSDVGEALAVYLDKADDSDKVFTPVDEVESLFESRSNHFQELERYCERISASLSEYRPGMRREAALKLVDDKLSDVIEDVITTQPQIETSAGKTRARDMLSGYSVAALLLPMSEFADTAAEKRYDIEALGSHFSCDLDIVCQRLTALSNTGHSDIPSFGYFRANAAGTIIRMHGLERMPVPRYAAACPLWILFRAQQSPDNVFRQRAIFPSGARFVFVAKAFNQGQVEYGKPRHYVTDMIAMSEDDAYQTVYSPDDNTRLEEVGPSCRLCPREQCLHRVIDPLSSR
ncbi:MAG: short-chain fatty acyl-CoA regulator family protein [Rhodospirillales bacterium]